MQKRDTVLQKAMHNCMKPFRLAERPNGVQRSSSGYRVTGISDHRLIGVSGFENCKGSSQLTFQFSGSSRDYSGCWVFAFQFFFSSCFPLLPLFLRVSKVLVLFLLLVFNYGRALREQSWQSAIAWLSMHSVLLCPILVSWRK